MFSRNRLFCVFCVAGLLLGLALVLPGAFAQDKESEPAEFGKEAITLEKLEYQQVEIEVPVEDATDVKVLKEKEDDSEEAVEGEGNGGAGNPLGATRKVAGLQFVVGGRVNGLPDGVFIDFNLLFGGQKIADAKTSPNEGSFLVEFPEWQQDKVCPGVYTLEVIVRKNRQMLMVQRELAKMPQYQGTRFTMNFPQLGTNEVVKAANEKALDEIEQTVDECRTIFDKVYRKGMKEIRSLSKKKKGGAIKDSDLQRINKSWVEWVNGNVGQNIAQIRARWDAIQKRYIASPYPQAADSIEALVVHQESLWRAFLKNFHEIAEAGIPDELAGIQSPRSIVASCRSAGQRLSDACGVEWKTRLKEKKIEVENGSISEEGIYISDVSGFEIPVPYPSVNADEPNPHDKREYWFLDHGKKDSNVRLSLFFPSPKLPMAIAQVELFEVPEAKTPEDTVEAWRDLILRDWPNAEIVVDTQRDIVGGIYQHEIQFRSKDDETHFFLRVATRLYFREDTPSLAYGLVYTSSFSQLFDEFTGEFNLMTEGFKVK